MHIIMLKEKLFVLVLIQCFATTSFAQLEPIESVEWKFHRNLYDYHMYGAITLEIVDIPAHTILVNLTFNMEHSSADCPLKHVKIYANEHGLPVVSREGEAFPSDMYVRDCPVLNVTVASNNRSVVWELEHLQAGQLFLMAVMPPPDPHIKQKGLGLDCDYSLTTRAQIMHFLDEDIPQLLPETPNVINIQGKIQTLYRFSVPDHSVSYTVHVTGCTVSPCPLTVSLWDTPAVQLHGQGEDTCVWSNGTCLLQINSPPVDSWQYLTLDLTKDLNLTITVEIKSSLCDMDHAINDLTSSTALNLTAWNCVFAGELGRETPNQAEEGSNFYDHFVAWDDMLFPHSVINVNTSDQAVVVIRFKLRTSDTGSSLKVYLHIPIEKSSHRAQIHLCLRPHRMGNVTTCEGGATLNVTSQDGANKDHVIVPYPQGGSWFITLHSQCFKVDKNKSEEVRVPCKPYPVANLTVHLSPCIDGGCGDYGTCKLYFGADVLYSACNCYSGWRGYGCNDGSKAESAATERAAVYLLTLSNLGFLPGICLAIHRRYYVEALVYFYNMFFSTFYHACDTSQIYQLCIMPYNALSFADFFASLLSFWVTLMAMARIPDGLRSFLHMLSALFISLGEVYNRHGLVEQLLPIVGGVAIVLISWGIECYKRRGLFPSKPRLLKFILPGVLLSCLGLIFNLALETDSNYKFIHSMWHLFESICILFLLPPRRGTRGKSTSLSVQSGDISRHSLVENDEFQANIHRADDTGNTPSSEPSSPPETPSNSREWGFKLLTRNSRRSQNLVL